MSHQTGIQANETLRKYFAKCRDGSLRVIKVSINNEELVMSAHKEIANSWEHDYDGIIKSLVEENQPCYIVYRLDTKNNTGYDWLLISWSPDTAPVRQKMLYASTKASFKKEFGNANIKEELHGTIIEDITLKGYQRHKRDLKEPAPLTTREEDMQELKRQVNTGYSVDSKQNTGSGLSLPIADVAGQAICDMARGSYEYLQFNIDIDMERIHLVTSEIETTVEELASKVPKNNARYHLFKYKHTHEGDYLENIVFIYSMPGYNCSIKERMLYSSCKGPFTEYIDSLGLEIVKKLEIDDGSELTEDFLQSEIHPKQNLHRPKFAKPKGPPNRGAKRLTKPQLANQ